MNYSELKQEIDSLINTNGAQKITGAVLNSVLRRMVSSLGFYATFAGEAFPNSSANGDTNACWLAMTPGTYEGFDGLVVENGEIAIFHRPVSTWLKISISSGIGGGGMQNITYDELRIMASSGDLTPGKYYRITDYETTFPEDDDIPVAGHVFDLIVMATTERDIDHRAMAALSERDTSYFGIRPLHLWQIWYDFKNELWTKTGLRGEKGSIYRMIDEFGNDCPYDFKNVLIRSYAGRITQGPADADFQAQIPIVNTSLGVTGGLLQSTEIELISGIIIVPQTTSEYLSYTFGAIGAESGTWDRDYSLTGATKGNTIKGVACIGSADTGFELRKIVIRGDYNVVGEDSTAIALGGNLNNLSNRTRIGKGCKNIYVQGEDNTIGDMSANILGMYAGSAIGAQCSDILTRGSRMNVGHTSRNITRVSWAITEAVVNIGSLCTDILLQTVNSADLGDKCANIKIGNGIFAKLGSLCRDVECQTTEASSTVMLTMGFDCAKISIVVPTTTLTTISIGDGNKVIDAEAGVYGSIDIGNGNKNISLRGSEIAIGNGNVSITIGGIVNNYVTIGNDCYNIEGGNFQDVTIGNNCNRLRLPILNDGYMVPSSIVNILYNSVVIGDNCMNFVLAFNVKSEYSGDNPTQVTLKDAHFVPSTGTREGITTEFSVIPDLDAATLIYRGGQVLLTKAYSTEMIQ